MAVEPVPGAPAAVATLADARALVVADYHAGIEHELRRTGVELADRAERRRRQLLALVAETDPDRLVVVGDLVHAIGEPSRAGRAEIDTLLDSLSIPVTLVRGNHDGEIESLLAEVDSEVTVTPATGARLGPVGFAHGHTWPSDDVLQADVVCLGHEHPVVRLEDEVGGSRMERAWLRGQLDPEPFRERDETLEGIGGDLVVCPAFNDLSGGTWVNVDGQSFLSPFLPEGLAGGEAYLLDGTRLGAYQSV
jgi:putative SbcD/Mre11-related phosphoesterase